VRSKNAWQQEIDNSLQVSILIMLDSALEEQTQGLTSPYPYVSILIMLDSALEAETGY